MHAMEKFKISTYMQIFMVLTYVHLTHTANRTTVHDVRYGNIIAKTLGGEDTLWLNLIVYR